MPEISVGCRLQGNNRGMENKMENEQNAEDISIIIAKHRCRGI